MSTTIPDASIHQGATAPYALRYDVTSSDPATFDLSTVTSAIFRVRRENGDVDEWSTALSDQTTTTLRLTHTFSVNDVAEAEDVIIEPRLTTPGGEFVCEPKTLRVREAFT